MSDFWFGVFAGLAVWELIQTLLALVYLGEERKIDRTNVVETFALMVLFMGAAWWIEVGL